MRNAIILHGTDGDSKSNWIPWLKEELEIIGYDVWTPDLPNSETPNLVTYTKFIGERNFNFNSETILIGHSSGAVAILGLLPKIGTPVEACFLVSAFENDLGWPALGGLFKQPFNFEKIRENSGKLFFIHSDNDPYIPLIQADHLALQSAGTLVLMSGQGHFNLETSPDYNRFYKLLGKIKEAIK